MKFTDLDSINLLISDTVWGYGLYLLIACGITMTVLTKGFQFFKIKLWLKSTIFSVFSKKSRCSGKSSISRFQAFCTALAATIGVGNIAGVAAAIKCAGPGAIFWMQVAAILGMMTSYAENVLGIYFRRKNKNGQWSGGAMYYLKYGIGSKKHLKFTGNLMGIMFAIFTILASFGTGNMGQVNKIVINLTQAFEIPVLSQTSLYGAVTLYDVTIGMILTVVGAIVILGGLERIAKFTEKVVPFMIIVLAIGSFIVIYVNRENIIAAITAIFANAFKIKAVWGAAGGISIKYVINTGCKRGMFSNEAGLGSSAIINANSDVKEPVEQGMWGIFEVFTDTMIVCTMTALVILTSGVIDLSTGRLAHGVTSDATMVASAFGTVFGAWGDRFVALVILLFAFTTVLGWSHYGAKAVEYLFGESIVKAYKIVFVSVIFCGAVVTSSVAWDISDTFNGLMMLPNLIGIFGLKKLVKQITENYISRKLMGKKIKPILSAYPDIQKQEEKELALEELNTILNENRPHFK